jgi:hypothetical protein
MSGNRSATQPAGAGIFSAADLKRRVAEREAAKARRTAPCEGAGGKAKGGDGRASQTAREDSRATDASGPHVSTAQIRCCTCGHRRIEMRSSHPWLMS